MPLHISHEWIEAIRAAMPELPDARKARFIAEFGITPQDAGLLTDSRQLADYFEAAARTSGNPKAAANWMMGDLSRLANAASLDIANGPVSPANLAAMIHMIGEGTISGTIAKALLEKMFETGEEPGVIADREGLKTVRDTGALMAIVDKVFAENADVVTAIKEKGLVNKRGFLVGQVMKQGGGKLDAKDVNAAVDEKLK